MFGCFGGSSTDISMTHTRPADDRGDLVLQYMPPQTAELQDIYESLLSTGFYDQLAAELNNEFAFPQDISVTFDECGEENAFYSSEDVAITMCYELIDTYAELFYAEYGGSFDNEVIFAGYFTFLHELGHALVDQYQLPIVAREEDVVDAFAAFMLVRTEESDAVIAGIDQFDVDAESEAQLAELPFWDEHSLSEQRVYNVSCLVYGSDPDSYQDWVDDDLLPLERAEQCEEEYALAEDSWEVLLAPFIK